MIGYYEINTIKDKVTTNSDGEINISDLEISKDDMQSGYIVLKFTETEQPNSGYGTVEPFYVVVDGLGAGNMKNAKILKKVDSDLICFDDGRYDFDDMTTEIENNTIELYVVDPRINKPDDGSYTLELRKYGGDGKTKTLQRNFIISGDGSYSRTVITTGGKASISNIVDKKSGTDSWTIQEIDKNYNDGYGIIPPFSIDVKYSNYGQNLVAKLSDKSAQTDEINSAVNVSTEGNKVIVEMHDPVELQKDPRKVDLKLLKYDKEKGMGAPLSGAEFDISISQTGENGINKTISKVITGSDGSCTILKDVEILNGNEIKVTITETKAPSGYKEIPAFTVKFKPVWVDENDYYLGGYTFNSNKTSDYIHDITTLEMDSLATVCIPNEKKSERTVDLYIYKYDKELGQPRESSFISAILKGVEFDISIKGCGVNYSGHHKTDDYGGIYIQDLKFTSAGKATITITETKAPTGYKKIEPITITIDVIHYSANDDFLDGYGIEEKEDLDDVGVDASGKNIGVKRWASSEDNIMIYIPNEKMKLNLTLTKFDGKTKENLSGATFKINLNGSELVDSSGNNKFTINNGVLTIGNITITNPDDVTLILTEVAAPQYYINIGTITIHGKVSNGELKVNSIDYDTSKTNSEVKATCEANTMNLTIDIPNKRETITLSGCVWEDTKSGKETNVNGKKDGSENYISGITVNLYKYPDGTLNSPSEYVGSTKTDSEGAYEFKVDKGRGYYYYVEFVYNGYNYEHTVYTPWSASEKNVTSNATEKYNSFNGVTGRTDFNKKFETIDYRTTVDNKINETDATTLTYNGVDISIRANTGGNLDTATRDTDIARFNDLPAGNKWEHINLGLVKRQVADIALMKDVYKATVSINGYTQDYIYNKRQGLAEGNNGEKYWEIRTRRSDAYYNESYIRGLKSADYQTEQLSVTVTYKISIRNQSEGLIAKIPSITDYYDKDYAYSKAYIGDSNGNKIADIGSMTSGTMDEYYNISFTGMNINLNPSEEAYIYIEFNVNKDENNKVKLDSDSGKENVAEITSYKTYYVASATSPNMNSKTTYREYKEGDIAGRVDEDSNPGNANPKDKNSFEDDTDSAPPIKITEENDRVIAGNVWLENRDTDVNNAMIGDGIKQDSEGVITGITVDLIEVNTGDVAKVWNGSDFVDATTTTGADGNYSFSGFIPGKYYVRFTYPDGQTYKSTTYHYSEFDVSNPDVLGKADLSENTRYSDARDLSSDRQNVNALLSEETNKTRTDMETADKSMRAVTGQIEIFVEKNPNDTSSGTRTYEIPNIDFGLVERPRAQLTLNKEISNVKVTLANGNTLFDASQRATNVLWLDKTKKNEVKMENKIMNGYEKAKAQKIQLTMDEELMQGATIRITYKLTVTNEGEVDYKGNGFYYLGDATGANVVKTKVMDIIDYVGATVSDDGTATPNNLKFNVADNAGWTATTADVLKTDDLIADTILTNAQKYNTIAKYTFDKDLSPKLNGEAGSTATTSLVLTQTMSSDSSSDDLSYNNIAEIVKVKNDVGRKMEYSIVGNQDPNAAPAEVDSDSASVVVLPPFGQTYIYYALGIGIAVITIGGIIIIKKKVLKK